MLLDCAPGLQPTMRCTGLHAHAAWPYMLQPLQMFKSGRLGSGVMRRDPYPGQEACDCMYVAHPRPRIVTTL
jgi:hypothetical protein